MVFFRASYGFIIILKILKNFERHWVKKTEDIAKYKKISRI